MSRPSRIQRKRTKGWRMPEGAVYVGRVSRWGNQLVRVGATYRPDPVRTMDPFLPSRMCEPMTIDQVVDWYREYATPRAQWDPSWLAPLRGKDLACWCPLDQPCHADVLLELANR